MALDTQSTETETTAYPAKAPALLDRLLRFSLCIPSRDLLTHAVSGSIRSRPPFLRFPIHLAT